MLPVFGVAIKEAVRCFGAVVTCDSGVIIRRVQISLLAAADTKQDQHKEAKSCYISQHDVSLLIAPEYLLIFYRPAYRELANNAIVVTTGFRTLAIFRPKKHSCDRGTYLVLGSC